MTFIKYFVLIYRTLLLYKFGILTHTLAYTSFSLQKVLYRSLHTILYPEWQVLQDSPIIGVELDPPHPFLKAWILMERLKPSFEG